MTEIFRRAWRGENVNPQNVLSVLDEPINFLSRYAGGVGLLFLEEKEKEDKEVEKYIAMFDEGQAVVFPVR